MRTTSASGKFASTCLPRGEAAAAGSAWISRTECIRRALRGVAEQRPGQRYARLPPGPDLVEVARAYGVAHGR
ncbi:hypothetical protein GCM10010271_67050 [Streptomyces kurssanovii]|nr:hypothetical protein GCM10010271_67050 [Streptomyces kurssanovii]